MFLYPKSFVLCSKIVLSLEYMVLTAIYIINPGYYRIHGNRCPFSLYNHYINLSYSVSSFLNVSFIHSTIFRLFTSFSSNKLKINFDNQQVILF